jgi:hypothetical protein
MFSGTGNVQGEPTAIEQCWVPYVVEASYIIAGSCGPLATPGETAATPTETAGDSASGASVESATETPMESGRRTRPPSDMPSPYRRKLMTVVFALLAFPLLAA